MPQTKAELLRDTVPAFNEVDLPAMVQTLQGQVDALLAKLDADAGVANDYTAVVGATTDPLTGTV
jgi:hypothetical protein